MYVTKGFIDPHTHYGLLKEGFTHAENDINDYSNIDSRDNKIDFCIDFSLDIWSELLDEGITYVCVLPGSASVLAGQGCWVDVVKKEIIKSAGHKIALGENPKNRYNKARQGIFNIAGKFIKKEKGIKRVHAHAYQDINFCLSFDDDKLFIEHCTNSSKLRDKLLTTKSGIIFGPILDNVDKLECSEQSYDTVKYILKNKANSCMCSDYPCMPPKSYRFQVALLGRYGFSTEDRLYILTSRPAKMFGIKNEYEVVWDKDPMKYIDAKVLEVRVADDTKK